MTFYWVLDDIKRAAAIWILKVKEKHRISQMAMQEIIQDVTELFQTCLLDLCSTLKSDLRAKNVDEEIVTSIEHHFGHDGKYGQPFRGLGTEYYQLKYFKEQFSMVVSRVYQLCHNNKINLVKTPQTIVLGSEQKMKGSAEKRKCVEVKHTMMYVPIQATLERLLQNKNVLSEVCYN